MKKLNSERGGILGALLITGAVIVCLMIIGGIIIARTVHVNVNTADRNGAQDVSIDLPGGHLNIHAHDKAGAVVSDIPMYPGAHSSEHKGGDAVVQWSSNKGDKGFSVSASESITSDPVDKVVDWYRDQLPRF